MMPVAIILLIIETEDRNLGHSSFHREFYNYHFNKDMIPYIQIIFYLISTFSIDGITLNEKTFIEE